MIASMQEILAYMGLSSPSSADQTLLQMVHTFAERNVKDFVGYQVEQGSYTHFLPDGPDRNDRPALLGTGRDRGFRTLMLTEVPVQSVTSIHEYREGYGSPVSSDWPNENLLVSGTDYYVDWDRSGKCRSGFIHKISGLWSTVPRSVRVAYVAGYTPAELTGQFSAFKQATLIEVVRGFNEAKANRGVNGAGAVGTILSESLADYSVSYDGTTAVQNTGFSRSLSNETMKLLEQFQRRCWL